MGWFNLMKKKKNTVFSARVMLLLSFEDLTLLRRSSSVFSLGFDCCCWLVNPALANNCLISSSRETSIGVNPRLFGIYIIVFSIIKESLAKNETKKKKIKHEDYIFLWLKVEYIQLLLRKKQDEVLCFHFQRWHQLNVLVSLQ